MEGAGDELVCKGVRRRVRPLALAGAPIAEEEEEQEHEEVAQIDVGGAALREEPHGGSDARGPRAACKAGCEKENYPSRANQTRGEHLRRRKPRDRLGRAGDSPLSEQTGGEQEERPPTTMKKAAADVGDPSPAGGMASDKWAKLNNLALLFEQGFILETEFKERRSQLIDELTGTRSTMGGTTCSTGTTSARKSRRSRVRTKRVSSSIVVPRPPPSNFEVIPPERARKHYFDLATRSWHAEEVMVRLDDTPFARGGLRLVYHLQELARDEYEPRGTGSDAEDGSGSESGGSSDEDWGEGEETIATTATTATTLLDLGTPSANQGLADGASGAATADGGGIGANGGGGMGGGARRARKTSYVAKIAIDPNEDPSTYFRDVEMQAHCEHYARLFNSYTPPRRVEFVKAWILELTERKDRPLCAVERFVAGDYRKHNNNYGYVSEDERNTPQAFSHFTYEASAHSMLVVDIQGVGDCYTDPQLHTLNQGDFGKGNLGIRGFHRFLSTHHCNRICRYLKLPPVNPRYTMEGTIPNLPYMPAAKINRSHFREGHYFEATPALVQLIKEKALRRQRRLRGRSEETDSFLRYHLWDARDDASVCHICPCTVL